MSLKTKRQKDNANLDNIVVATIRPWNIKRFSEWKVPKGYRKLLITSPKKLTFERLSKIKPRFVFFPHWSWIIPPEIYENFECVVFHEANLPYGRGGSPIQNHIVRGIYKVKISALRVEAGLDTGPIYLKKPVDMSRGSAQDIFYKISAIVYEMMSEILLKQPKPKPQRGRGFTFKRRKPEQSRILGDLSGRMLYDFIRMLDADGYPRAFLDVGEQRFEFSEAEFTGDTVTAKVKISPIKNDGKK